jgi:hypothetical protein
MPRPGGGFVSVPANTGLTIVRYGGGGTLVAFNDAGHLPPLLASRPQPETQVYAALRVTFGGFAGVVQWQNISFPS